MYLVGFILAWLLGRYRARRPEWAWTADDVTDLVLYAAIGVLVGGRVGYILFYDMSDTIADPLSIFRLNEGGMSFHGGLIGVLLALYLFARKQKRRYWEVLDYLAPLAPLGLFFGRIGNFINGELWGAPTDLPWAMAFPSGGGIPRHPSMLYEAILEGLVLFAILWWFSSRRPPVRAVSGLFLAGYGTFRFLVEFVREPDAHIGYLFGEWFTMGMLLSTPMIIGGALLFWLAYKSPVAPARAEEGKDPELDSEPDPESEPDSEQEQDEVDVTGDVLLSEDRSSDSQ